jgi:hypothetical protein
MLNTPVIMTKLYFSAYFSFPRMTEAVYGRCSFGAATRTLVMDKRNHSVILGTPARAVRHPLEWNKQAKSSFLLPSALCLVS